MGFFSSVVTQQGSLSFWNHSKTDPLPMHSSIETLALGKTALSRTELQPHRCDLISPPDLTPLISPPTVSAAADHTQDVRTPRSTTPEVQGPRDNTPDINNPNLLMSNMKTTKSCGKATIIPQHLHTSWEIDSPIFLSNSKSTFLLYIDDLVYYILQDSMSPGRVQVLLMAMVY
ncbi:hypothetical protein SISNIDRAFT_469347 [Sistotremastrum niveocremeum HHB9708]|uniref:Uncharacterized protein n=1 Tax=Sistotremastrum niveocremeum HHB9708 TaxID=1314777 RepID=A0A164Q3R1_9AGAM|nr:hypothetical protein SISNIDRAFT_469347 [Sistotremastrum niveocremeum HHB9708]